MTDGFLVAYSCYNLVSSYDEMMSALIQGKAKKLFLSLKKLSAEDPAFNNYPRLKSRDDASVVVASCEIPSRN